MEELCSTCLCGDRNLQFIEETGFYHIYTQIMNEIPESGPPGRRARVCWQCAWALRRAADFGRRARAARAEMLRHMLQNTSPPPAAPRLRVRHLSPSAFPAVKLEPLVKRERDDEEHSEEMSIMMGVSWDHDDKSGLTPDPSSPLPIPSPTDRLSSPPIKEKKKKSKRKTKLKNAEPPPDQPARFHHDLPDLDSILFRKKEDHGREEKMRYKCDDCDVSFEVKVELDSHVGTVHVDYTEREDAEPLEDLKESIESPPPRPRAPRAPREPLEERPTCVECGKVFSSRKTYRYHLNVLHKGQNRYPCPLCGKIYQWKSNLGRHLRSHKARDTGELYCEACDKRFASVATYRQHLSVSRRHVSESEFSFVCSECGKKFVNKTRLRDHIDWEHLKKIKFRCQLCNKPFKCHTSLYVHMQNVHRNKEKKDNLCHVCGKSYQNAAKLKYHIVAMHTSETPYQCEQCNAAFGWYSSLYRHVREVHYKIKLQPSKGKKSKKAKELMPPPHSLPLA